MKLTTRLGVLLLVFLVPAIVLGTEFDELDKAPEGAHKGQMLLGGFIAFGSPSGSIIDGENSFVSDSQYTFTNGVTKEFQVSHLAFGMGVTFEYMPIDYIGAKARLKRTYISQKTDFGPDYRNWQGTVYQDFSFYVGPSFHTTVRKRWDFTLTPMLGYAYGTFKGAPIANSILPSVTGNSEQTVSGITYGAELNCTIYFSGGLFVSLGGDWTRNPLTFNSKITLDNSGKKYMNGASSGTIDSLCFILTAGYAFSN
jgi:hypothetical protein